MNSTPASIKKTSKQWMQLIFVPLLFCNLKPERKSPSKLHLNNYPCKVQIIKNSLSGITP
jgi:hypothetical protein